jgi:2-polyprenyl-6-methoxyphenol hydroxylase-like FAD-dependent oxidoreductase
MIGMHGDHPPTDPKGFEAFAESLPVDQPKRFLENHERVSEIQKYPFPNHQRHRYEALESFPTGLVVVGDAICSFNPMYAQGMSVAALEAVQLHHALAGGNRSDLARRFFDRAESVVDIAWGMAVGSDMDFEGTEGPEPSGSALFDRYMARLSRTAHADPAVAKALHHVVRLEEHPSSLLRPGIVWRVLKPTV